MRRPLALTLVVMLASGGVLWGALGASPVAAAPRHAESRSIAAAQSLTDGCTETLVSVAATDHQGRAFPFAGGPGLALEVTIDRMDTCTGKELWRGHGRAEVPSGGASFTMERATLTATFDVVRTDVRGEVVPFALDLIWSGVGRVATATSTVVYYPDISCVTESTQRPASVAGTMRGTVDGAVWAFGPEGWDAASMERQRQVCDGG